MPVISNFPGGNSEGGIALPSVTDITTVTAHEKVYLKWTDPNDLILDGVTLAAWEGTLLVRKAGSVPTSRRDGVIVLDSKTRNAYQNTYFCDSGLSDGVTYYYKFFPYTTEKAYTDSINCEVSAIPNGVAVGNISFPANSDYSGVRTGGNGKMRIWWNDPSDTVYDGVTLATWASTVVVVKENDYATSPTDPDAAFTYTNSNRNKHAAPGSPLTATGLKNDTTYYVSFFPVSSDGTINTDTANRIIGMAGRMALAFNGSDITQTNTLVYNGESQEPEFTPWYADVGKCVSKWGRTSAINSGIYMIYFAPKDDYKWKDGTRETRNFEWKIFKADGSMSLSSSNVTLDPDHLTSQVTVTRPGNGAITVASSDTSVATASVTGDVITISHVNQTSGTAAITVHVGASTNYTAPENQTIIVMAEFATIYGAVWDGTATTAWSRTDAAANFTDPVPAINNGTGSSPFDNLMPWSGMVRVTDAEAGELVAIPKFWFKWTQVGNGLKLQIADGPVEGFHVSPAHMDRGDGKGERDMVYVGRYHCSDSNFTSHSGWTLRNYSSRPICRTSIHAIGQTIWQFDYAMLVTIQMLYLVEYADWDSQIKIGYGCSNDGSLSTAGKVDGNKYHTGTSAVNQTTYGYTQYRYIEGLWDNLYDWIDGCYIDSSGNMYVILDPNNFDESSNGVLIGQPVSGYPIYPTSIAISSVPGTEWAIYPTASGGSTSSYIPDNWSNQKASSVFHGSCCSQSLMGGLFYMGTASPNYPNAQNGCRLQKLP